MKRLWIPIMAVILALVISAVWVFKHPAPETPMQSSLASPSEVKALQSTVQNYLSQKAQIAVLQRTIVTYEAILKVAPDSQETQKKLGELRRQLSELEQHP